ncbi:hypothetical protein [Flavobacterium sp. UBA6135]|uniref:hypothetical protein n=1 Tax=Flavobacterium sp. UBA6135 TaxID=1946553 RepID=UPI0025BA5270|nr:hypothetical protein [Flavobacterium sp. UBA6135]
MKFEIKITEIDRVPFVNEEGNDCIRIIKKIETPRQTFIKGNISGKYRGNLLSLSDQFYNTAFYDFEIYEAIVENAVTQKNTPFQDCNENEFPREKLPEILKVTIVQFGKYFGINILEPRLCQFNSNRKLHQIEGNEIFGTFEGIISGYILDYEEEIIEEIDNLPKKGVVIKDPKPSCEPNGILTGKTEKKGNYVRKQYYCKHHNDTVWGKWEFIDEPIGQKFDSNGCLSSVVSSLGLILGLIFLFFILPGLMYVLPIVLFFILLHLLAPYLKCILRIISIVLLIAFISSIINSFNRSSNFVPKPPLAVNEPREQEVIEEFKEDIKNPELPKDTLFKKYRYWKDYDGNEYEGEYTLLASAIRKSSSNKNYLRLSNSNERGYDEMLYRLKENDKTSLDGVYKLFDSIGDSNKMNQTQFANMVVSFVQDMPYVLILDNACNANLYSDRFIKQYLKSSESKCVGFQRFGINTPLEFLYSTDGDCDTRTLLLYTIFAHYNYDVAVMSSEQYGHSILGINLPIKGVAYKYQNQRYVLWETTAYNAKPGLLPNEISNLNYWRISLKSN